MRFRLEESTVSYTVSGSILRTYLGGRSAPETRRATLVGLYRTSTVNDSGAWTTLGTSEDCSLTMDGEPLPARDVSAAKLGKWTVPLAGGRARYTWDGEPRVPSVFSVPFWPVGWAPMTGDLSLKIGDLAIGDFDFPLQTILEDDPIGDERVPIRLRFDGPEAADPPVYRFLVETNTPVDRRVHHPEDPELRLKGSIAISGTIDLNRRDGRVESATLLWLVDLGLEGPGYPFGFSKARLTASTTLKRVR